ncbi:MAG: hypothetical protein WD771_00485 [Gemmatimonadaceae bacterium]
MIGTAVRLARARRTLVALLVARALLLSALVGAAALTVLLVVDVIAGIPLEVRSSLAAIPWVAAFVAAGWFVAGPVRAGIRATEEQVALWFERRLPSLQYALVTQASLGAPGSAALEEAVAAAPLEHELRAAAGAALLRPALALAVAAVVLALAPAGALARLLEPAAGDALARPLLGAGDAADPLATIVVRVTPPAYADLAVTAFDDPATVSALAGSQVTIEGRGRDVRAIRGVDTLTAAATVGGLWRLHLPLPVRTTAIRLLAPARERVLLLEPVTDSAPTVRLILPGRDTVLRVAAGRVALEAELLDDLGLADGAFELIISSGGGEFFTFRSAAIGAQSFARGARAGHLASDLVLDTLKLVPGDLVHLRAVGHDRNDVTGPGRGVSETRTLRIARADEYDSVSVDPLPPSEPEKGVLSQRMILLLTEELHAREPRLSGAAVAREARAIAVDQTKLRKRVGEVVFQRLGEDNAGEHSHFAGDGHDHGDEGPLDPDAILAAAERAANVDPTRNLDHEGDETPVVAINRPLLEAYNHMWRASSELETANPGAAIPWMERAIEALQRARAAERIYLRGRPARVVVDLARVRGTGRDTGTTNARAPRPALDPERATRLARFDVALSIVVSAPAAAADSLLLLRVTVPADDRAAALALDAAAAALRRGGDLTRPLAAARRALAGDAPRRAPLTAWGH